MYYTPTFTYIFRPSTPPAFETLSPEAQERTRRFDYGGVIGCAGEISPKGILRASLEGNESAQELLYSTYTEDQITEAYKRLAGPSATTQGITSLGVGAAPQSLSQVASSKGMWIAGVVILLVIGFIWASRRK